MLQDADSMKIFLKNLRFYAYHGVLPQERIVGTYFMVDMAVSTDFSKAMLTDDVADTLNYADVYDVVKTEMSQPSNLIEHVAGRIISSVFQRFDTATSVTLRLTKENPPIVPFDGDGCGVEVEMSRTEWLALHKK